MTPAEIKASERAIDLLYNALKAKGLLTPEVKKVFHEHMNSYTELKKKK